MTRIRPAAGASVLAALVLAPAALARPADVNIVSSAVTIKVSSRPSAPSRIDLGTVTLSAGVNSGSNDSMYAVPAGQDLVIIGASGYFAKALGDTTALAPRYEFVTTDGLDALYAPLGSSPNVSFFGWTARQTMIAANSVGIRVYRDNATNSAFAHAVIFGYLVNEGSAAAAAAHRQAASPALEPPPAEATP